MNLNIYLYLPLAKSPPLDWSFFDEFGKMNPWSVGEGVEIEEVVSDDGEELLDPPLSLVG